jgi:hypothetical protein
MNKEILPVDFGNKLDQSIVEKPKLSSFLQSLLKTHKKETGFLSSLSTSISSQHEMNKTIVSGDGMDETAVLDNTIWTIEKDANSVNLLHHAPVSEEKTQDEKTCEITQVFHKDGAMEETKVISSRIWTEREVYTQEGDKTQILNKDGNMEETKVLTGGIWNGLERNSWIADSKNLVGNFRQVEEETQIFGKDDDMEETKALAGEILNTDGNMEDTKVLTGGIWNGLERSSLTADSKNPMENFRQVEEETQIFGKDDDMEETKALTGEISIGDVTLLEKSEINEWLENSKTQTASVVLEHSTIQEKKDVEIEREQRKKNNSFMQEDSERKEKEGENNMLEMLNDKNFRTSVVKEKLSESKEFGPNEEDSEVTFKITKMEKTITDEWQENTKGQTASGVLEDSKLKEKKDVEIDGEEKENNKILTQDDTERQEKEGENKMYSEMWNDKNCSTSLLKEKVSELKEFDTVSEDSKSTFENKKIEKENEAAVKDDCFVVFQHTDPLVDPTKPETELGKHGEEIICDRDDGNTRTLTDLRNILKRPTPKVDDTLLSPDESLLKVKHEDVISNQMHTEVPYVNGENKTRMFSNQSVLLDETKMEASRIETVSNQTMSEEESIEENKTISFDGQSAMMEETQMVPTELAQENELMAYGSSQTETNSGTIDKLLTIPGNNETVFFGKDTGMMNETKITTSPVNYMKHCSEEEIILPAADLSKSPENITQDGRSMMSATGVQGTDEKSAGVYIKLFLLSSCIFSESFDLVKDKL